MTFIPTHAQQLVIIQWMDSCIPKEEEHTSYQVGFDALNQHFIKQYKNTGSRLSKRLSPLAIYSAITTKRGVLMCIVLGK
jgi:hypothetical protein